MNFKKNILKFDKGISFSKAQESPLSTDTLFLTTLYSFNATTPLWKDQPGKRYLWCSFESIWL